VSGAGAAAADDVGSVIDFSFWRRLWALHFSQAGRDLGSDEPTRRLLPQLKLRETITICVVFLRRPEVCVLTCDGERMR
jgi:hypothetical protein